MTILVTKAWAIWVTAEETGFRLPLEVQMGDFMFLRTAGGHGAPAGWAQLSWGAYSRIAMPGDAGSFVSLQKQRTDSAPEGRS